MRRALLPVFPVLMLVLAVAAAAPKGVVERAIAGDESAIAALRAEGPAGLAKIFKACADRIAAGPFAKDPAWPGMVAAIDAVAQQKDAYASNLYWYTDLDQAKAAAASEGKPILSLRLLGRLDQDLSCANSRFFRTTLYPDSTVSKLLREKFVLHWGSERPVPVVTIDMGDGRTIKRTITGNSIHYVLDATGRPIDALPGLYSADMFVRKVSETLDLATKLSGLDESARAEKLAGWHGAALNAKAQVAVRKPFAPEVRMILAAKAPPAEKAERLTVTKAFVETPLLASIRKLEDSVEQDSKFNESTLHRQIHEWFLQRQVVDLTTFNDRVYAELFLTPRSDPWLGLAPADVHSALDQGGIASR